MELVDGAFWGFNTASGFDIDMFIEDNRITDLHNAKIISVKNFPYAAEFEFFNYTYFTEKCCPFDEQPSIQQLKSEKDHLIEIQKIIDDNFYSYSLHRTRYVYCGGMVDLCGGNNLSGIVPCNSMIVSEEMKNNIIKEKINGCSFFNMTVCPNQTSIDNVLLSGINMKYIYTTDLFSYFEDVTFNNTCPFCNEVIACRYCKTYPEYCPFCGKQVSSYISSLTQIDNNNETLQYLIYDDFKLVNIIPGEYWNGEDLLEFIGAKGGHYIGTKRFFDFLECHQYGPIIALPLQVDVSRCTDEQKNRINALLK
ncbi:MAG: hypothetical protein LBP59_14430 [Planctomycetaceae bacterium]|jgi:hypothetical protein|nr:hypothetical protein [Planctomycetaceae bacterium]